MKCSQEGCSETAVVQFIWPGRTPMIACEEHGQKARGVAQALGFRLNLLRLEEPNDTTTMSSDGLSLLERQLESIRVLVRASFIDHGDPRLAKAYDQLVELQHAIEMVITQKRSSG